MNNVVIESSFNFPGQLSHYKGKVRDVYTLQNNLVVMIASDRISAFDHVLPKGIPYKGQVLNQIAKHFLEACKDIVPHWLLSTPDANVAIGMACQPYKVEMVIRGYLAGHAYRVYKAGGRELCGIVLPEGLKEGDPLPSPIITPSTKASQGHDQDISKTDIIASGIVEKDEYEKLEAYTHALYKKGSEMAKERGLILVDTKYEFGKDANGEIRLIDEIHTPDSSRYYVLEGYSARQNAGLGQIQLSKEFVREWLMENGFQGLEGQTMPLMPDEFVQHISDRYIDLYEKITGKVFVKVDTKNIVKRIQENTIQELQNRFML